MRILNDRPNFPHAVWDERIEKSCIQETTTPKEINMTESRGIYWYERTHETIIEKTEKKSKINRNYPPTYAAMREHVTPIKTIDEVREYDRIEIIRKTVNTRYHKYTNVNKNEIYTMIGFIRR